MFEETVLSPTADMAEKAHALVTACEVSGNENVWNKNIPSENVPPASWGKAIHEKIERCIHDLIYERSIEQPDAPAVCAWDGGFSYCEIEQQSSALAQYLRRRGVGAEIIVPVLFEKSRWTTIAILAILKAGGAFTLLDPSQPPDRLKEMVNQIGALVMLVSPRTASLEPRVGAHAIVVGDEYSSCWSLSESTTWRAPECQPDNAAYVLFTSGSTGKPKALVMEHAAICCSLVWSGRATGLRSSSRTLQFSSHTFDIATYDHLMTLIFGGCICVPSDEERKSDLAGSASRFGVTYAVITPTVSRLIEPQQVPTLRTLVLAGETISIEDIERWGPFVRLLNMYGPAETGCSVTVNGSVSGSDVANIGYSTGAVAWVVDPDDHHSLRPVGEVGELVVQGHNVARGYLGDPVKSQTAFIDRPAWLLQTGRPDFGRLYKTGDMVRYDPKDGSLQFLGRKDSQIKIHGQRIELGEVEYQLKRGFPGHGNVVVELVVTDAGKPNLIGFVSQTLEVKSRDVEDDDKHPDKSLFLVPDDRFRAQARSTLTAMRKTLPSYMIPSDLMRLSYLPVTASGKTDRRRLRTRALALTLEARRKFSSLLAASRDLPSCHVEERLQALWSSVLGLARGEIGVHDNFFHLGATSVDAIRLGQFARQEGLDELTATLIFECPTIRLLAATLKASTQLTSAPVATPTFHLDTSLVAKVLHQANLRAEDIETGVFPVTWFQRKWLEHACVHIGFELPLDLNHSRLEEAWAAVQQRHAALRSVYVTQNGTTYQMFLRECDKIIPIERCTQSLPEYAETYCNHDATKPVPDGSAYWRLTRLTDGRCSMLIIRANHAIFDAISLQVIFRDFVTIYGGDELPRLSLDFPAYMLYRLHQNSSPDAAKFWKKSLSKSSMSRPKLRDETTPPPEDTVTVYSSKEIEEVTPPPGITMGSLIRAAWALVLSRYTKQDDVIFGEITEGRAFPLPDIMGVVGCTAAESPMRMRIPSYGSVYDFLQYSQRQHARRIPYETSEFGEIVQHCTDWPSEARFSTYLVLEYPDPIPPVVLDGHECRQRVFLHGTLKDIYVQVVPMKDKCQVAISGPNTALSKEVADTLVERLAGAMVKFASMPDRAFCGLSF
ncbi:hypothetical protein IFM51744_07906 [Aspergillus udagawae]|nr:hypothetical protein IFM51744_07906 [Aspergillus udagawae]